MLGSGLRGLRRRALEMGAQTHLLLQELSSDSSAPGENKIILKMISFQTNAPQARASPPLAIQWGSLWVTLSGLGWQLPCLALWLLSPPFATYKGRASGPAVHLQLGFPAAGPEKVPMEGQKTLCWMGCTLPGHGCGDCPHWTCPGGSQHTL